MSSKGTILAALCAVGAVLILTAAGLDHSEDRQHAPTAAAVRSEIRVSYVKSYSSFTALRADSSAIVEITAGKQYPDELAGLPVTVTNATVKKVVWGEIPVGSSIEVRQIGTSSVVGVNTSKLLVPGTDYLVFVVPSSGALDAAPDRYLITGDAGVYESQRGQYVYRGGNTDPNTGNSLPATLQATGIEHVVSS